MSAKLSMTKLLSTVFHFSSDNNLLQKCPCCLFLTRVDSLYIKYFLQSEKNAEETGNAQKCTYAEVTRTARNPTRRLSKNNNADNKHKQNLHEKLRSTSPTNWFRRQGNNLNKKLSNSNTTNNYTQQQDKWTPRRN